MLLPRNLIRRLDLLTLQLFVAVHEEGTLTRAADRELIALSAASKRLVDLEAELGVELFIRRTKGMSLTPAGESLLHHARVLISGVEKLSIEMAEYAAGIRGHIRMLANLSTIIEFLPEDLRVFSERHAQIKIDLEESPSGGVVQGVLENKAEIGLCDGETDTRGLQRTLYREDRLVLVMRPEHSLAAQTGIPFSDALEYDQVGLHAASAIQARTQAAARQARRTMKVRIHVPGFDAMCRMIQTGLGIGVLPARAFELFGPPLGLHAVNLLDEWAQRELVMVTRAAESLSPVGQILFDHLRMPCP